MLEDIKTGEKSKKIKITRVAVELRAQSPNMFPSFCLSLFPLSSDATWSPVQVTALFNDAICLMPSSACQSISHYPSSCLSWSITSTPWLQQTKEQRASPETSLQWPIRRSILQTNWWETQRKRHAGNNNKQQQKQRERGRWWAYLLSYLFLTSLFCWSRRFNQGTNWDEGGSQRRAVEP